MVLLVKLGWPMATAADWFVLMLEEDTGPSHANMQTKPAAHRAWLARLGRRPAAAPVVRLSFIPVHHVGLGFPL